MKLIIILRIGVYKLANQDCENVAKTWALWSKIQSGKVQTFLAYLCLGSDGVHLWEKL